VVTSLARPSAGLSARAGLLQICLAGMLWGTGGLAVKLARRSAALSPLTVSGYRTAIAAVVLLAAVLLARRTAAARRLLADHGGRAAVTGMLTASYQVMYFVAVVEVGISVSTVIALGVAPTLLTAGEAVRHRAWPAPGRLATVLVALMGLALVTFGAGSGTTGPHPVIGVVAAIGSGTVYAAATALGEPLAARTDPLVPVTVAVALVSDGQVLTADPAALGWLAYLGAVTMALAYALLYAGLRTTPGSAAVLATLLEPVTAAVAAAVVFSERLGAAGIAGTLLILAALVSLGRRGAPPPTPAP
jgi:DME family drug/metabolite transporter